MNQRLKTGEGSPPKKGGSLLILGQAPGIVLSRFLLEGSPTGVYLPDLAEES